MIVSYKYRAYPDATTETRLNAALDTRKWLYNKLLEECNTAREGGIGISTTMQGMQARIVTLKEENPALKDVYSKVLQMVNYTLWSNIAALSQTKKRGRKIGKTPIQECIPIPDAQLQPVRVQDRPGKQ